MAATLATVKSRVTEILNACAAGTFSATIASGYLDRNADAITEAVREAAMMIARAILANASHPHRNLFIPNSFLNLTHRGEMPDAAAETDIIEIQRHSTGSFIAGTPKPVTQIESFRENPSSLYSALSHTTANSPLAGYYAIKNGRFYFTGLRAAGYFPVVERSDATGVAQVETLTLTGSPVNTENASLVVTAAGMPGSPYTTSTSGVAGTLSGSATNLATAAEADVVLSKWFTITPSGDTIVFTAKGQRANDTTMDITVVPLFSGLDANSSANTTAGVAPGITTLIPDEYESTWVCLAVPLCMKEGDNLLPIAQQFLNIGLADLAAISGMNTTSAASAMTRLMKQNNV